MSSRTKTPDKGASPRVHRTRLDFGWGDFGRGHDDDNSFSPPTLVKEANRLTKERHRGKWNLTFCDGHIEYAKQTNWMIATDRARRRWNNDNEPHQETWRNP